MAVQENNADEQFRSSPSVMVFRAMGVLLACAASSLPGLSYISSLMPPKWNGSDGIALVVAVVACLGGFFGCRKKAKRNLSKSAGKIIGLALIVFVVYLPLLDYLTESPPPPRVGPAEQIGFGLQRWSLTQRALDAVDGKLDDARPPNSPQELMKTFGVWSNQNPVEAVWKYWTIITAGLLLDFIFFPALALWGIGLGVLTRVVFANMKF